MAVRPLKSFFSTADELLQQELSKLGEVLLLHLKSYQGLNTVWQHAGVNRKYFRAMLDNQNVGLGPLPKDTEYGVRQPEVTKRMLEAWNWLERQGLLIHNDEQAADWFLFSSEAETLLPKLERFARWDSLGLDRVKADLTQTGGREVVGGSPDVQKLAWDWVRMKENKPPQKPTSPSYASLIADSRILELRGLASADFDFTKLVRLCEELNIAFQQDCYFSIAMLTRGLLDHVPPIFGMRTFVEVANNYSGGGRSFKQTIQHLENAARNVADAHLHMPIRKSETLPVAQQVCFGQELDVLLSEVVRISK